MSEEIRMTEIIDLLKKYIDGKQNTEKVGISVLQLNRVIKALEEGKLIPVSERFPKDEQDVLIQYGNSMFVGYHITDNTKYDPGFEDSDSTGWYDEHDVFIADSYSIDAWMPLPKPYKQNELEREGEEYDR